jgi:hypothetical protein
MFYKWKMVIYFNAKWYLIRLRSEVMRLFLNFIQAAISTDLRLLLAGNYPLIKGIFRAEHWGQFKGLFLIVFRVPWV